MTKKRENSDVEKYPSRGLRLDILQCFFKWKIFHHDKELNILSYTRMSLILQVFEDFLSMSILGTPKKPF